MFTRHRWPAFLTVIATIALLLSVLLPAASPVAATTSIYLQRTLVGSGDNLTVTGYGFTPQDNVLVYADFHLQGATRRVQTVVTSNGAGAFTATITIPAYTTPGVYRLSASDLHRHTAAQSFIVLPVVFVQAGGATSTVTVVAGHRFFLRAGGFKAGETVKLTATFPLYNGNATTVGKNEPADKNGSLWDVLLQVPFDAKQGTVTLTATGQTSSKKANANVDVVYRPVIALSSNVVRPGGSITITGSGFVPGATIKVSITIPRNGSTTESLTTTAHADQYGSFSASIFIPSNARPGTYSVTASGSVAGFRASLPLTVTINPTISLSTGSAFPGQTIVITGGGYSAGVQVTVGATFPLFGGGTRTVSTTAQTNGNGSFSTGLSIPRNAAAGAVTVTARGPNGQASAQLSVKRLFVSISVSPASVIPGGTVTIKGYGYLPNARVDVGVTVTLTNGSKQTLTTPATTNGQGQFTATLHIPGNASGGTFTVTAKSQASGRSATAHLTVARLVPSIVAVPTTAIPGTQVTISGFGFAAGQTITVYLGAQKLGTASTNGNGQFTLKVTIPNEVASGTYRLSAASSGGRTATIDLTVNRRVSTHYYFASFYTGAGYHEYLAFLNPSAIRARVTITYEINNGTTRSKTLNINAHSRFTEDVNADLGFHISAGAVVAADVPIVATRVVYHGTDGAVTPGATSPSTVWYLANGNTGKGYREYLAIANPNTGGVQVVVTFYPAHHRAFTIYRNLAPTSRTTISVNRFVRKDAVGLRLTSNGGVVANRSTFIDHGMTSKIGVTAPQRTWYFAAGPSSGSARNWIGAMNPTNHRAYVTLHAYGPFGLELGTARGWLKPHARVGYLINRLAGQPDAAVVLQASRSIIAEQTTYIGRMHNASTDTFGAPSPARTWVFAFANTGGSQSDVLTLFNPNPVPIPVVVDFMTSSGGTVERTYIVGPLAHRRVYVDSVEPNAQLGLVVASNYPFVALNRASFNHGLGSDTSPGVHL